MPQKAVDELQCLNVANSGGESLAALNQPDLSVILGHGRKIVIGSDYGRLRFRRFDSLFPRPPRLANSPDVDTSDPAFDWRKYARRLRNTWLRQRHLCVIGLGRIDEVPLWCSHSPTSALSRAIVLPTCSGRGLRAITASPAGLPFLICYFETCIRLGRPFNIDININVCKSHQPLYSVDFNCDFCVYVNFEFSTFSIRLCANLANLLLTLCITLKKTYG
ncbi:hypothetical protein K438DRAFT_1975193 [Mycena galopus ATCC 62051]|nr:hypothetical protein K438DRAFT_1975193 [Mycena galopus ATCC 62051]